MATPFVFVADDAFPMGEHLLKPYHLQGISRDERIFNYRLSRARRISENAFGILANRFRIFLHTIELLPANATNIILAAVILHNFLRSRNPMHYIPPNAVDTENGGGTLGPGDWRQHKDEMQRLSVCKAKNATKAAKEVRLALTGYFRNENAVPWQDDIVEVIRRRPIVDI